MSETSLESPATLRLEPSTRHDPPPPFSDAKQTGAGQNGYANVGGAATPEPAPPAPPPLDTDSPLDALVGTPAYLRWRPRAHLMPRRGWVNDPCAPGYDPAARAYHVGFQWNPRGTGWADISWGAARSRDLVFWTVADAPSLAPGGSDRPYDRAAVFTGCMCPSPSSGVEEGEEGEEGEEKEEEERVDGDEGCVAAVAAPGQGGGIDDHDGSGKGERTEMRRRMMMMTCVYTAVKHLPIHYSIPYVRGSETVAVAVSSDTGWTWTPLGHNPVVAEPPPGLDITGWRDPFVAPWPTVDRLLRGDRQTQRSGRIDGGEDTRLRGGGGGGQPLYALLSGGIRGRSPTSFLYEARGAALDRWRYLGPLVEPGLNFSPSARWIGDFGVNWEVCNFVTLSDAASGASRDFLICGVEGRLAAADEIRSKGDFRATHAQMWMSGPIRREGQVPRMRYRMGGILDHGGYYAGNSFRDPLTGEQVIFGWLLEEDLPSHLRERQGWAGVLSLPRVLRLLVLPSVVGALASELSSIASFEFVPEDGFPLRYTGYSLCAVPDPRLAKLRGVEYRACDRRADENGVMITFDIPLVAWEAQASFSVRDVQCRVGLSILHGPDEKTDIYLDPVAEAVVIDRSASSSLAGVRKGSERAPHTLFRFAEGDGGGSHVLEKLEFQVFYDCSVLEVFVNQRTAITARIYPSSGASTGLAILGSHGARDDAGLIRCSVWPLRTDVCCGHAVEAVEV